MTRSTRSVKQRKLKVGDRVRIHFGVGGRRVVARVIEDRGFIGVGGRQIVRVERKNVATEPVEFELPAEEVTLVR